MNDKVMPVGRQFQKGESGNPGGRPKVASALKEFWVQFFESDEYRNALKARILSGKAPAIELYLHSMVYGKPEQTIAFRSEVARPILRVGMVAPEPGVVSDGRDEERAHD